LQQYYWWLVVWLRRLYLPR